MKTLDEVRNAKEKLRGILGCPPWGRGIGISQTEAGEFVVRVNVSHESAEIRAAIPESVDGVGVNVEVVGDIQLQAVGGVRRRA